MTDAEIDAASLPELRTAYRQLRDHHRDLVSSALQQLRQQGLYTGGHHPYGYTLGPDGRTLVAVPLEQFVISKAKAMRKAGLSYAGIACTLEEQGFVARSGQRFTRMAIMRMLRPPTSTPTTTTEGSTR